MSKLRFGPRLNVSRLKGKGLNPKEDPPNTTGVAHIANTTRSKIKAVVSFEFIESIPPIPGSELEAMIAKDKLDTLITLEGLKSKYGNAERILSGASVLHKPTYEHGVAFNLWAHRNKITKQKEFPSMADWYDTGCNLNELKENYPFERWKFYLSLDQSTEALKKLGDQFMVELIERCQKQKISIGKKTFDHTYDSANLYTWHPLEIIEILNNLYPKYRPIFIKAPRFFQRRISENIPLEHIGLVQEPPDGDGNGNSHSARMGRLGALLDQGIPLETACKIVGVNPTAPWELDKDKYYQKRSKNKPSPCKTSF